MNQPIATVTNNLNTLTLAQRNSWAHFHRFGGNANFYGVVNKEGEWVDSCMNINAAIWAAAMAAGIPNTDVPLQEMATEAQKHGYSVVHSSMLELMFHAGALK